MTYEERDIPSELLAQCEEYREKMIEAAAEASDELMEKYLEGGELTAEEIKAGIRKRTWRTKSFPRCVVRRLRTRVFNVC